MRHLNNTVRSLSSLLNPAATLSLAGYLYALILAVLIAGCDGGASGSNNSIQETIPASGSTATVVAKAGPIIAVRVGETAILDGSRSSTLLSAPLTYSWSFAHKPDASDAVLLDAATAAPSFTADSKGVYTVQFTVSADGISSQRAMQIVIVTRGEERRTGRFNHPGLSSDCVNCHDGVLVNPGKPATHIASSNLCQACHTPQGAAIIPYVDHQEVFGSCSECHNGIQAIGKSEFHTPTDAECDNCHNTSHFLQLAADGSFDHSDITRSCSGCHNGTVAIGKTATASDMPPGIHPDTSSECGNCHTTASFVGAYPDHTGPDVVGPGITCDSCHRADGSGVATGQPAGHPDTTTTGVDCISCHSISGFNLGGVFNHSLLDASVQPCMSCHNDSNSINAPGKNAAVPSHKATTSDCGSCHSTDSFNPAFSIDHTGIVSDCGVACHVADGSGTAGGFPLSTPFYQHMPTSDDCSACHTPGTFSTGRYDHAGVASGCNACHNNVISLGKLPNHIPTSPDNQDCADCHVTPSFAEVTFDHNATDTSNCLACHDGTISKGKYPGHVATELNCASCHIINNGFSTFAGTFAHDNSIVDGACASCHNTGIALPKRADHIPAQAECSQCHDDTSDGGFISNVFLGNVHSSINNGCEGCHISKFLLPGHPDLVKDNLHLPTQQDCDVCHTNTSFMAPTNFAHTGITGNCTSCHDGNFVDIGARQKTATHPVTTEDCGICHNSVNFADATFDHTGRTDNCSECHGDNANGAVTKKNTGHVTTSEDCSLCHVPGTFSNAVFDHQGIVDNCASCHDGSGAIATVKTDTHLPTTDDCSVCHNTTAFAGARFDHSGITDNCASCHDGITAPGKTPPPNHVPTSGDCSVCHQTTGFTPAAFDHTGIVDNCSSCHDGAFARGKTDSHLPTSQDCGICHTTGSFIGAVFDHSGIVDNCESCHDGVTAPGKDDKSGTPHLATALDCHFCHTTATFVGGTWAHDASSAGRCDDCHNNSGGARAKPSGHLNTSVQCDTCHSTNGWAPDIFSHDPLGNYPGDHRRDPGCSKCHGSTINDTLSWPWPTYAPYCAACHANDFKRKDRHIGGESGTVEQNKNCAASGCHRITSSEF